MAGSRPRPQDAVTIPDLLIARATVDPERVAMRLVGGAAITFADWDRRSSRVARGLLQQGIDRGHRVGLLFNSAHWIEFAVAYCAVQKAGAAAVPIAEDATAAEISYILASCEASLAVSATPHPSVTGTPWVSFGDLDKGDGGPLQVRAEPGDLAQILYTSGTSGKPKGVGAIHENMTFGCRLEPRRRVFAHSEHAIHAFPIGTTAGQIMLLNTIVAHPCALVLEHFDAKTFCEIIEKFAVGTAFVVPAMAIELLNSKIFERYDLSSVIMLSSSGSTLPPSVAGSLTKVFRTATVINTYTSTEAQPAQVMMMFDPERPTSVGLAARASDIRILGKDGSSLPAGEVGDVWLHCPTTPRAYYGDPIATAEVFREGWVRMGDVGYLDDKGYLYLVDRESDVIKSGAIKVSTTEVEAVLHEHPHVREAAVFGVPHSVLGSLVAVAVVLDSATHLADVRAYVRGRLATHKVPVRWLVVDQLPRNQMGKVVKRELPLLVKPAGPGDRG